MKRVNDLFIIIHHPQTHNSHLGAAVQAPTEAAEGWAPCSTAPKKYLLGERRSVIHSGRILSDTPELKTSHHLITKPGYFRTEPPQIWMSLSVLAQSSETMSAFSNLHCILCGMLSQSPFVSLSWKSENYFFVFLLLFFFLPRRQNVFFIFSQLLRCDLNKLHWALSAIWELLSVTASSALRNIHLKQVT